jgi:hypothetical protein
MAARDFGIEYALDGILTKGSKHCNILYILDSGASVHIFNSRDSNINLVESTSNKLSNIKIQGIAGNTLTAVYEGQNPSIGRYLIVPTAATNLLSVSEFTAKGIEVKFIHNKVIMFTTDNVYEVEKSRDGLYYLRSHTLMKIIKDNVPQIEKAYGPTQEISNHKLNSEKINSEHLPENIVDNANLIPSYTPKQKARAAAVHMLHYVLGHPSNSALANVIESGNILNTDIVRQDIDLYVDIYGPCPHCIAGKIKRPTYKLSRSAATNKVGQKVHMDLKPYKTQQVDGGYSWLLISVDQYSGYLYATKSYTKNQSDVTQAFKDILAWYKSNGHIIENVMGDSESTLKAMETDIRMMGINTYYSTPYQHAQLVERYVQTINCRIRSIVASLPYILPLNLYGELLQEVIQQMNFVPNYLHPTQTPSILFNEEKFNLRTHKKPPFGTPAMFHQPGQESRAELGIILSYSNSSKGYQVRAWCVNSQRVKIRHSYTVVHGNPIDLGFLPKASAVSSHVPDFILQSILLSHEYPNTSHIIRSDTIFPTEEPVKEVKGLSKEILNNASATNQNLLEHPHPTLRPLPTVKDIPAQDPADINNFPIIPTTTIEVNDSPSVPLENPTSEIEDEILEDITSSIKPLTKTSIETISDDETSEEEHHIIGKMLKSCARYICGYIHVVCQIYLWIYTRKEKYSKIVC